MRATPATLPIAMSDIPATAVVAYLGPEGTYTHAALRKYFGDQQPGIPLDSIPAVFAAVASGQCDFGVVPVENSSEGSITQTLDCFGEHDLNIFGEVSLRIEHCLLAKSGTTSSDIQRIFSHQQSLGQCRQWLKTHYPDVEQVTALSNAEAARKASLENGAGAIAGHTAADIYGLEILAENIEDVHDNTTRFAVISRQANPSRFAREKSTLIISTENKPGALFNALEPFKNHEVNLIRLESRPSRKQAWSYSFYVDIDGHCLQDNIRAALNELESHAMEYRVLGSYPVAEND